MKASGKVLLVFLAVCLGAACSDLSSTPAPMREFADLHKNLLKVYQNGTSVQKDQAPSERKKALAAFMSKSATFTDWPAEVKNVHTEGGSGIGKLVSDKPVAVLSVVFDGITLENSYAEILMDVPGNVIAEGSPLYAAVTGLQKGQKVKISGSFALDKAGLPRELSITTDGAFERPEYVVTFTAVKP